MSYCTDFQFKAYLKPEYRKGICDENGNVKLANAPYKPFRDFCEYMDCCYYEHPLDYGDYDEETGCWEFRSSFKHMLYDEYDCIIKLLCDVSERVEYCRKKGEDWVDWIYYDISDGEVYIVPGTILTLNCTIKPDFADDLLKIGYGDIPQYIQDFMEKHNEISLSYFFDREGLKKRRIDLKISLNYVDDWIDAFVEFVSLHAEKIEHCSIETDERREKYRLHCD